VSEKRIGQADRQTSWVRALGAGCLTAALSLLAAPVSWAADTSITISEFRSYLTEEHPVMRGMQATAQRVIGAGNGHVNVEVTAPLRSSPYEIVEALMSGERLPGGPHLVVVPAIGLVPVEPAFELLNLPYLIDSYSHADEVLKGPLGAELLARLEEKGLIGLAWWENGFQHLYSATTALHKPADFAGLTLRLMPDAGYAAGFQALGAKVVNAPFSEIAGLLERGEIDALDSYTSQFFHSKIYQPKGYLNLTGHSYSAMLLVMSRADWDSLDARTQELLRAELPRAAAQQRAVSRASELQAISVMTEEEVNVIPEADIARDALASKLKAEIRTSLSRHDDELVQLLTEIGYFESAAQ
jgi:TRAP-type C4-dicarboxylate transport system substrate-binding protein